MANIFNRVALAMATTGTGPVTFGSPLDTDFLTPAEAGAVDSDTPWVLLQEGGDFQLFRGTVGGSVTTVARTSTIVSKIGGSVGTSNMDLQGSATLRFVEPSAAWLAENIPVSPAVAGETDIQSVLEALEARRVGEFFWYTGDTAPAYGLTLNGSAKSRTTYARLWAWIQTSGNLAASEGAKLDGEYGPGDGSTTFTLPDLITAGRFVRAAVTVGAEQADGAPNITGQINAGAATPVFQTGGGAFTLSGSTGSSHAANGAGTRNQSIDFSAAASNAKYGAASEIRPTNVGMLPCVVF